MKYGFRQHDGESYSAITDKSLIKNSSASCNVRNCQGIPRSDQPHVREIHNLLVGEDFRGNGLGSKLMKSVCEEASKFGIMLLVLVSNENRKNLIRFYKRFGFAVIQDGESCIMIRNPVGEVALNG